MYIVNSYPLAVVLCFVTMLCWGSWGNTQKLAAKTWRYELFYWDYVIGILLFSIIMGFTLGSFGEGGRSFVEDLRQADMSNIFSAIVGGIVFNAANILLSASVSLAGLAVAFPLGVGIALVLGVFVNYFSTPKGDPVLLFIGVALIVIAIIFILIQKPSINKNQYLKTSIAGVELGILNWYSTFFFLRVIRLLPISIFIPLYNICFVLLSVLLGRILFKEKFDKNKIIGSIIAILSIVLLSI